MSGRIRGISIDMRPDAWNSGGYTRLRVQVEVEGQQPVVVEKIMPPDDVERWLDRYMQVATNELRDFIKLERERAEREHGMGDAFLQLATAVNQMRDREAERRKQASEQEGNL
jgi:hypothetical protein